METGGFRMYLQDFIIERNLKQSTIAMFMKRHQKEFDGHTELRDRRVWLDDVAVTILSKKYPTPMIDEIWSPQAKQAYDSLQEELRDANAEIRLLIKTLREYQEFEMKYRALEMEYQLKLDTAINQETTVLQEKLDKLNAEKKLLEEKSYEDERRILFLRTKLKQTVESKNKSWIHKLFRI